MIAALVYILLFSLAILFFRKKTPVQIPRWAYLSAFLAKILCGFVLTWIYTGYYPDRKTADIYKYYDDAKVMYSALPEKPADYVKMMAGIGNDNPYFDSTYYMKMNNWYKRYDFGTYNDNHTIIRFNALVMPLAFGSFHVHTVFMCFFSFVGLWLLCHVFIRLLRGKKWLVFLSVFCVPSVLFWGSGVLKEGILLFSIGLLFYAFYKIVEEQKRNALYFLLLLVALFLLLINKNYLLISLVPPLFCYYLVKQFRIRHVTLFFFVFHLLLLVAGLFTLRTVFHKYPLRTISEKQRDFINLAHGGVYLLNDHHLIRIEPEQKETALISKGDSCALKPGMACMKWQLHNFNDTLFIASNTDTANYKLIWDLPRAGSLIQEEAIAPNVWAFVGFAPKALYNVLLKPGILQAKSLIEKMAAVENIFIAAVLLLCLLFADPRQTNGNLLNLCLYAVLILFLIIGFTTPVAGAIVRYKMPLLPLLLLMGVNVAGMEKVRKRFPFLKKK
jgi:uncharacterized membrane protein YqjE